MSSCRHAAQRLDRTTLNEVCRQHGPACRASPSRATLLLGVSTGHDPVTPLHVRLLGGMHLHPMYRGRAHQLLRARMLATPIDSLLPCWWGVCNP